MTGQVKEDCLARFGELGVHVKNGCVSFGPVLLKQSEFITKRDKFNFYNINGEKTTITVEKNSLAFTYIQIPIIYTLSDKHQITITLKNNERKTIKGTKLKPDISRSIFNRTGEINKFEVSLDRALFN